MSQNFKKDFLTPLGRELAAIRKKRNLSQADVALVTDLSVNNINILEQGRPVSYAKYKKLLRFYGKKLALKIIDA